MIDSIQALQKLQGNYQAVSSNPAVAQQVKEEFLAIFYRELLKQSFQPPTLSSGGDNSSGLAGSIVSDMYIDKMAQELAQSGSLSLDNLLTEGTK